MTFLALLAVLLFAHLLAIAWQLRLRQSDLSDLRARYHYALRTIRRVTAIADAGVGLGPIKTRPRGAQAQLARCQDQPYEQSTRLQWMSAAIDLGSALRQADRDVVALIAEVEILRNILAGLAIDLYGPRSP